MANADQIRMHATEKYVLPAHRQGRKRFSIRVGDVVRELKMVGRVPAVCSALGGNKFLLSNGLRLADTTGPKSGQSTTVTYTYEFVEADRPSEHDNSWKKLRGMLKDVFAELGGGEAYLRDERRGFYPPEEGR